MYFTFYSTTPTDALWTITAAESGGERIPLLLPTPVTAGFDGSTSRPGSKRRLLCRYCGAPATGAEMGCIGIHCNMAAVVCAIGVASMSVAFCVVLLRLAASSVVGEPPAVALLLTSAPFLSVIAVFAALLDGKNGGWRLLKKRGGNQNQNQNEIVNENEDEGGSGSGSKGRRMWGVDDVWMGLMVECGVVAMLLAAGACSTGLSVGRVVALLSAAPVMGAAASLTFGGMSTGLDIVSCGPPGCDLNVGGERRRNGSWSSRSGNVSRLGSASGNVSVAGGAGAGGGGGGGGGGKILTVLFVVVAAIGVVLISRGAVSSSGVIAALVAAALCTCASSMGSSTSVKRQQEEAWRVTAWFAVASCATSFALADGTAIRAAFCLPVVLAGAAAAVAIHAFAVASRRVRVRPRFGETRDFIALLAPLSLAIPLTLALSAAVRIDTFARVDAVIGTALVGLASAAVVADAVNWFRPSPFFSSLMRKHHIMT